LFRSEDALEGGRLGKNVIAAYKFDTTNIYIYIYICHLHHNKSARLYSATRLWLEGSDCGWKGRKGTGRVKGPSEGAEWGGKSDRGEGGGGDRRGGTTSFSPPLSFFFHVSLRLILN